MSQRVTSARAAVMNALRALRESCPLFSNHQRRRHRRRRRNLPRRIFTDRCAPLKPEPQPASRTTHALHSSSPANVCGETRWRQSQEEFAPVQRYFGVHLTPPHHASPSELALDLGGGCRVHHGACGGVVPATSSGLELFRRASDESPIYHTTCIICRLLHVRRQNESAASGRRLSTPFLQILQSP